MLMYYRVIILTLPWTLCKLSLKISPESRNYFSPLGSLNRSDVTEGNTVHGLGA